MAKLIEIKKGEKVLHVSEKAFEVVYAAHGYHKVGEVEPKAALKEETEDVDLFLLTEAELKKVNKDKIVAFLEKEEIEFDKNDKKENLIKLITGEEDDLNYDNDGEQ